MARESLLEIKGEQGLGTGSMMLQFVMGRRLVREDQKVHFWASYANDGDGEFNQGMQNSIRERRVERWPRSGSWKNTNNERVNRKGCSGRGGKKERLQGSTEPQGARRVSQMVVRWITLNLTREMC